MIRIVRLSAALAFAAVALASACRADKVDDNVQNHMKKEHVPGLSLGVVKDGKVVRAKGYGFCNLELNVPASPETMYVLYSLSKQFVAAAAMQLVEQGKLSLDDPVSKWFPDEPDTWKAITVRQILSHTSGTKDYVNDVDLDLPAGASMQDKLNAVMKLPMNFAPGEKWRYNNTGFVMMAIIIQKITGQTTQDYLKQHIWGPLDMTASRAASATDIIPNRASNYLWDKDHWINGEFPYTAEMIAAGGMMSDVSDLMKWDQALYTDKVLSQKSRDLMMTPVTLNDGGKAPYGLGFFITNYGDHRLIWHYGSSGHYRTNISRFVDDKITVIVLTNGGDPKVNDIAKEVAATYSRPLAEAIAKG